MQRNDNYNNRKSNKKQKLLQMHKLPKEISENKKMNQQKEDSLPKYWEQQNLRKRKRRKIKSLNQKDDHK
jgi:hypothetical protein